MYTREGLPGRSPILWTTLGQARLTSEFLLDDLPEKKLQLVDMNILSILLSPEPGCHTLTPSEDRRPRRSTPVQELPLLDTSVRPEPTHVPRRATCPHT